MKKCLLLALIACALSSVHGAANDTLISFATRGPDKYADGTTVLDGECYALVWTRTGAAFEGLAADGVAVGTNSAVLVYAPVAKAGRCPTVVFELDAALAANYAGGTFGVYLLDTRLANGKVGGLNAAGRPVAVNGFGAAEQGNAGGAERVTVTSKSALPADAPTPQITAIKVVGENVFLTVRGTLPCLRYTAQHVAVGGADEVSCASPATQGAATPDAEITVITPKKGDSGFFKVSRE